jgi:ATP-dependent DNA helicase RecQ
LKQYPNYCQTKRQRKNKIVRYQSSNLINPLVQDILTTGLTGTTCVLTKTNEEAQANYRFAFKK